MKSLTYENPPGQLGIEQLVTPAATTPLTVTIADLRTQASISRSEAYRLLAAGKLRAVKSGTRTLVLWDSVLAYVESLPAAEFTAPKGQGR